MTTGGQVRQRDARQTTLGQPLSNTLRNHGARHRKLFIRLQAQQNSLKGKDEFRNAIEIKGAHRGIKHLGFWCVYLGAFEEMLAFLFIPGDIVLIKENEILRKHCHYQSGDIDIHLRHLSKQSTCGYTL